MQVMPEAPALLRLLCTVHSRRGRNTLISDCGHPDPGHGVHREQRSPDIPMHLNSQKWAVATPRPTMCGFLTLTDRLVAPATTAQKNAASQRPRRQYPCTDSPC